MLLSFHFLILLKISEQPKGTKGGETASVLIIKINNVSSPIFFVFLYLPKMALLNRDHDNADEGGTRIFYLSISNNELPLLLIFFNWKSIVSNTIYSSKPNN